MSIIERAAQRLEELRRAGIEVPVQRVDSVGAQGKAARTTASVATPCPRSVVSLTSIDNVAMQPESADLITDESRTQGYIELDLVRLAALGFITPDLPRSQIADEFRIIKRPLIANASTKKPTPNRHGNLIMVTSSIAGEGKTFSAVNLAISMATELNRTVLLVDADVARPSLPTLLELPLVKGLLDVLENQELKLRDVLLRTNIEKLSILASGTAHPHATELLASEAMAKLLDELSTRYSDRVIIFDSPPLLVTTEARVLASQMGQIVFVVRAESTLQSDVLRALTTIESCPIKLMVLNQAQTVAQGAYGYGYGYGHGA